MYSILSIYHGRVFRASAAVLAISVLGCANASWETVRTRDTVANYNQFLRDNPDSPHADEARERIAYLRVKAASSIDVYESFAREFPASALLDSLQEEVEPLYFSSAREQNSVAAYRAFLTRYPNGKLSRKAMGNAFYIEHVRSNPTRSVLEKFISEYAESDFAGEARATLELVDLRREHQIRHLGVRVDVAPNVHQGARVRTGFAALVARQYEQLGVRVTPFSSGDVPSTDMDAWVRVEYEEAPAEGIFGGKTLLAKCRVRIYHTGSKQPVWDRSFDAPAEHILRGAHGRDKTIFGNSSYMFWSRFYVPVATWTSRDALVKSIDFIDEVASIVSKGDRAVLLYRRGGFDVLDVSSPGDPKVLHRYRRDQDLTRWAGVEVISEGLVATYGPDGVEIVEMQAGEMRRIGRWEMHEVGAVSAAASNGRTLLFAGAKGVFAVRLENRPLVQHRLVDGEFVGVEIADPFIYLVRPSSIDVTTAKHLMRQIIGSRLRLGDGFRARRVRKEQDSLYVLGEAGAAVVDIADRAHPRISASLGLDDYGRIADVLSDARQLYLLGERGLVVLDERAERVADSIQVGAGDSATRVGRHALLVGGKTLEVLDLGPYYDALPAAPSDR